VFEKTAGFLHAKTHTNRNNPWPLKPPIKNIFFELSTNRKDWKTSIFQWDLSSIPTRYVSGEQSMPSRKTFVWFNLQEDEVFSSSFSLPN
jgi:hypothetical protein